MDMCLDWLFSLDKKISHINLCISPQISIKSILKKLNGDAFHIVISLEKGRRTCGLSDAARLWERFSGVLSALHMDFCLHGRTFLTLLLPHAPQ